MNKEAAKAAIQRIARALIATVVEAGPQGAPSSAIFLAFQQGGCTAAQYETIVSTMCELGLIRRSAHTLYAP